MCTQFDNVFNSAAAAAAAAAAQLAAGATGAEAAVAQAQATVAALPSALLPRAHVLPMLLGSLAIIDSVPAGNASRVGRP